MRIVAIALAILAAGCADDTVLRIDIDDPGVATAPSSLRVTLVGVNAAARTITPVMLPGTVVVDHVPSSVAQLCVQVDGLDAGGNEVAGGAANVVLSSHHTTHATVSLSASPTTCADVVPADLAIGEALDMAGSGGGDLTTAPDLAPVQVCPAGAIFCDGFESGDLTKWTSSSIKQDAGTLAVQSAMKAHGSFALSAVANGTATADIFAEVAEVFTPTAPPLALRANVYFPQPLQHYDHLIALYENDTGSTNNFSIGGDSNATWVVTENEAAAPDQHSDMVPTGAGAWHCIELVIDAAGMVTLYVDNHQIIGPWPRVTTGISYSTLLVGVTRSVDPSYQAYVDDVAVGPSRLYCPP